MRIPCTPASQVTEESRWAQFFQRVLWTLDEGDMSLRGSPLLKRMDVRETTLWPGQSVWKGPLALGWLENKRSFLWVGRGVLLWTMPVSWILFLVHSGSKASSQQKPPCRFLPKPSNEFENWAKRAQYICQHYIELCKAALISPMDTLFIGDWGLPKWARRRLIKEEIVTCSLFCLRG